MENLYFILLGLLVGAMVGMTGASGVLVMVPFLSSTTLIPMPIILGTSLLVDVIVSFSVTSTYASFKNVKVRGIHWILIGSFLGAQAGSFFVIVIPKSLIISIIAIGMIGFGVRMLNEKKEDENKKETKIGKTWQMLLWGIVVGLTTGLFGAGGGVMTFLMLRYFLKFSTKQAIGTSTLIMLITAIFGVSGYYLNENLDINLGFKIGVPAFVMGIIISFVANKTKEKMLNNVIGIIFITLALFMLILKIIIPLFFH